MEPLIAFDLITKYRTCENVISYYYRDIKTIRGRKPWVLPDGFQQSLEEAREGFRKPLVISETDKLESFEGDKSFPFSWDTYNPDMIRFVMVGAKGFTEKITENGIVRLKALNVKGKAKQNSLTNFFTASTTSSSHTPPKTPPKKTLSLATPPPPKSKLR